MAQSLIMSLYKHTRVLHFLIYYYVIQGNPVSAIVTFNLVVVPSLKKLMGFGNPYHTKMKLKVKSRIHFSILSQIELIENLFFQPKKKLGFDVELDERPEYHRGIIKWEEVSDDGYGVVYSTGNQHSSRLLSMNQSNCLLEIPSSTNTLKRLQTNEIITALYIEKL
jgi:gephyrin